ncbi:MAG TPA: glycosyltransferase family 4 protein [Anaerolineales bacterium]|jgi:glycosyltransferase involved in cell wall biosynthesis|nr:glycosyltransferase family 4 protein [Anaerolineales bacterium]
MTSSPRLNIAHFYQESSIKFQEPQAAQIHIYHTMHGLQRAGHEVSLLALQGRQVLCTPDLQVFKNDERDGGHYGQLGWSGTAGFKGFESGIRRLQSELHFPYLALFDSYRMAEAGKINLKGYDLIHERFNLLALGGAWASKKLGLPFVLEVNADLLEQRKFKGIPERGLRRLFATWATRVCFKTAAQIICISPRLKEHLRDKWDVDESKLTVLPCAADVEAFKPNYNSEDVRKRLGLSTEPIVMWIGGFYPWHDLSLLLESFALTLQRRPDARLVLVGDGQTRLAVENTVKKAGMQHAVIMTGKIAHSEMPDMLSIADVAVVPSAPLTAGIGGTGTPLKLFEYMAAGKAIVATALNEAAEVIQHGRNGILVEPGDVNAFAEATLKLINNPNERRCLSHNAREQAVKQFSWEHYTRRLEEIYFRVVRNTPSRSPVVNISGNGD